MPFDRAARSLSLFAGLLLISLLLAPPAQGQAPSSSERRAIQQQTHRALHGSDLEGRDGPMARIDADLVRLYHEQQVLGARRALAHTRTATAVRRSGANSLVRIDATARSGNATSLPPALRRLGLEGAATAGPLVSGWLPVEAIPEAASLGALRFARASLTSKEAAAASLRRGRVSIRFARCRDPRLRPRPRRGHAPALSPRRRRL